MTNSARGLASLAAAGGRPDSPVIQIAFTVPDIHTAMSTWVDDLGVGPWFLVESLTGEDPLYRGKPTEAAYALASAYTGDMQIELCQMNDDHPSAFREWVDERGYGLHHIAIGSDDPQADIEHYARKGYETVFSCKPPFGGPPIVFMSPGTAGMAMIEITPMGEPVKEFHAMSRAVSADWDGTDPVRLLG